ncbi:uncharacterized protein LOC128390743 [Panonychus citri]|uniref:uncharacterized protein LOC128390743 n=1 Tax=Panonychus citri TaxID=50023 RepID=UPI00230798DE|nr:uncharacterized protein LOC128390743 [Panonychus citri]
MKSILIVALTFAYLTACVYGSSVVSGSQLKKACYTAAHLLTAGQSAGKVKKIVSKQLQQLVDMNGQKIKKPGKPSLGYASSDPSTHSHTVNQQGAFNTSWTDLIVIDLNVGKLRSSSKCPSLADICSATTFPDHVDLSDEKQFKSFAESFQSYLNNNC